MPRDGVRFADPSFHASAQRRDAADPAPSLLVASLSRTVEQARCLTGWVRPGTSEAYDPNAGLSDQEVARALRAVSNTLHQQIRNLTAALHTLCEYLQTVPNCPIDSETLAGYQVPICTLPLQLGTNVEDVPWHMAQWYADQGESESRICAAGRFFHLLENYVLPFFQKVPIAEIQRCLAKSGIPDTATEIRAAQRQLVEALLHYRVISSAEAAGIDALSVSDCVTAAMRILNELEPRVTLVEPAPRLLTHCPHARLLRDILQDLLTNAQNATRRRHPDDPALQPRVHLHQTLSASGADVAIETITIEDFGHPLEFPGFDSIGRSTRRGGLGAGLYAAHAMAGVLGYTLRHRSKSDGGGSCIDIVIPAHNAPTNPA